MRIGLNRKYFFALLYMLLFVCAGIQKAGATHLVGGSVSYKYLGKDGSNFRYEITFTIYRDCKDPGNGQNPTPFDQPIEVGIYENDAQKELIRFNGKYAVGQNPDGDILEIGLWNEIDVSPWLGSACGNIPKPCMREGIYRREVVLPPSKYGYHIQYIRCCRNSLIHMPDNTGQTYYAVIPPTDVTNNSPVFTDVPIPFICTKDTVNLLNTAQDSDGDSLVFKLAWPFTGANQNEPKPTPPNYFSFPSAVSYKSGYSYINPFGSFGVAKIDPTTGLTTVYSPISGNFVLAIDVYEYRNGKIINVTRRDVQIIVGFCDPNNAPKRVAVNGSMPTTFTVTAGESLNFSLAYTDEEDNITMSSSGELMDPNNPYPKPIISTKTGNKSITTNVTVPTSCKQARQQPYILNITVKDDGCPPKSINHSYTIYVVPFKGADNIHGPSPACIGGGGNTYFVNKVKESSSIWWNVTGGLIEGMKDNAITIKWNTNATKGVIKMAEISANGCSGDTITKEIVLYPKPTAPEINGALNVCLGETYKYTLTPTSQTVIASWRFKNATQVGPQTQSQALFQFNTLDTGEIMVSYMDNKGCLSDTTVIKIIVSQPTLDSVFGSLSVCPNAKGIDYWVNAVNGSTYTWFIDGGSQSSGGNSDHITVDWGEKGGGTVRVVETTKNGCVSDTVSLIVQKDYILITPPIQGRDSVCELTDSHAYSVVFSNGSTYSWVVTGGTIKSGQGTGTILVQWGPAGKGLISVSETAWDPINNKPCTGKPVTKLITISPVPNTTQVTGPAEICEGHIAKFWVKGFSDSYFKWYIDGYEYFRPKEGSDTFMLAMTEANLYDSIAGVHILTVIEISKNNCPGPVRSFNFFVHPIPKTQSIFGPSNICEPNLKNNTYTINGVTGSKFEWFVENGIITAGNNTNTVTVDWLQPGTGKLRVREISAFGCEGKFVELDVKVDALSLEIIRVTTARNNENQMEVDWSAKNQDYFSGYVRIYRKRDAQANYSLYDSFPSESGTYVDNNVATSNYSYSYYIEATNICGRKVRSLPHKSILLKGDPLNDEESKVFWTRYQGWPEVEYYNVYKRNDDDTTLIFHDLTVADSFMIMEDAMDAFKQCYRVAAIKKGDNSIVSWSNSVCFDYEPIVWIPNAFSPSNSDAINDSFKVFASRYREFEFRIYDRWGEKLFTSTDAANMWDGTFRGRRCQSDVYMYILTVRGAKTNIYKSGTLHLIW